MPHWVQTVSEGSQGLSNPHSVHKYRSGTGRYRGETGGDNIDLLADSENSDSSSNILDSWSLLAWGTKEPS